MKQENNFNRLLIGFLSFVALLLLARMIYSGTIRYLSMAWNIFLAWLPYVMSSFFSVYIKKEKWKQWILFMSWLLFFPNALYIVTDLIHLEEETNVPLWYDAVLLFASSFAGIVMAFVSLQRAEMLLRQYLPSVTVKFIIPILLFLGSFGVYLGRFQRWNSWDVVQNPVGLGMDIATRILSPVDNAKTWATTIIFTGLYSMLYFFVSNIPAAPYSGKRNAFENEEC